MIGRNPYTEVPGILLHMGSRFMHIFFINTHFVLYVFFMPLFICVVFDMFFFFQKLSVF